jgi:hypothetical protein
MPVDLVHQSPEFRLCQGGGHLACPLVLDQGWLHTSLEKLQKLTYIQGHTSRVNMVYTLDMTRHRYDICLT